MLAAAASLRTAWLVGAFLSLSFATLAAHASGGTALAPFLLVAPLAPVLGVAAAYGPRHDPLESLLATAPFGRTRLILLRTIAVLVSVLPVTALLGLTVPGPPWLAAAWLGPALALVPVLLALAGFVGPRAAAGLVTVGWTSVVLASTRGLAPDLAGRGRAAGRLPRAGPGRLRWSSRSGPAPTASGGPRCERPASTVELTGVGKRYGRTRALADVDLAFGRGVTGLLGPNGAGKTTLLRIVATSIAADSGEVRLLGHDPHRSHADVTAVRRELGYLPQELGYPSDMTAFGFVEYVAVLKEWNDRERRAQEVRRVLDAVGLADRASVRISRLSGRATPAGRAGAGAAGGPAAGGARRADDRPRPGAARRPATYVVRPGRPLDGAVVHAPDRGRRGPLRARGRARRRDRAGSTVPSPTSSPPRSVRCGSRTSPARTHWPAGGPAPAGTTSSAALRRSARLPRSRPSRTPTC